MSSAFVIVSAAVKAKLLEAPALAGGFVKRGRAIPLPAELDEGLFVRIERTVGSGGTLGVTDWDTAIAVEGVKRVPPGTDSDDAIDPLLAATYERLRNAVGIAAGVMDIVPDPEIRWEVAEADDTLVGFVLLLRVNHRTGGTDLNPLS